jgi:hypothetical protein
MSVFAEILGKWGVQTWAKPAKTPASAYFCFDEILKNRLYGKLA